MLLEPVAAGALKLAVLCGLLIGLVQLYAFGIFWIVEVCDACQQFTVSYATVLWYYKPIGADGDKKSPLFPITRGFFNGIFFHLGTLAMGALLIAVVRAMQVVLWPAQKAARR